MASDQGVHVQTGVPSAEPSDNPLEAELLEIAECPGGHSVPEVVAPSPQHWVQPVQQVCKCSMHGVLRQQSHLCRHRGESLLRRVGVDRLLSGLAPSVPALDVPSEEVEPVVYVASPRLGLRETQADRCQDSTDLIAQCLCMFASSG